MGGNWVASLANFGTTIDGDVTYEDFLKNEIKTVGYLRSWVLGYSSSAPTVVSKPQGIAQFAQPLSFAFVNNGASSITYDALLVFAVSESTALRITPPSVLSGLTYDNVAGKVYFEVPDVSLWQNASIPTSEEVTNVQIFTGDGTEIDSELTNADTLSTFSLDTTETDFTQNNRAYLSSFVTSNFTNSTGNIITPVLKDTSSNHMAFYRTWETPQTLAVGEIYQAVFSLSQGTPATP
jgi:hypothetical protein